MIDIDEFITNIMNFRIIELGSKNENDFIIHTCMEALGQKFESEKND